MLSQGVGVPHVGSYKSTDRRNANQYETISTILNSAVKLRKIFVEIVLNQFNLNFSQNCTLVQNVLSKISLPSTKKSITYQQGYFIFHNVAGKEFCNNK